MSDSNDTHLHHAIDYIELAVRDVAESKRFYADAFGWTFNDYGPDYAGIQRPGGGEQGGLARADDVTPGGPLVVLYSNDLEESHARVKAAGGEVTRDIFAFPGGRRFQFRDPNGYELAVWGE